MGNAAMLPERIDAATARALVGNDQVFRSVLARAPWMVHRWSAGKCVSSNEAREVWEREMRDGASRSDYPMAGMPVGNPADKSKKGLEAQVMMLEGRLFETLTEVKALRHLRSAAKELPVLRGKLRVKTEECARLESSLARTERELHESRLDGMAVEARVRAVEARIARDRDSEGMEAQLKRVESENARLRRELAEMRKAESKKVSDEDTKEQTDDERRRDKGFLSAEKEGVSKKTTTDKVRREDEETALVKKKEMKEEAKGDDDGPEEDRVESSKKKKKGPNPTDAERRVGLLLASYESGGGDLKEAFRRLDESGDGAVSPRELWRGLRSLGGAFSSLELEDVEALVDRFDATEDGRLNWPEFAKLADAMKAVVGPEARVPDKPPPTADDDGGLTPVEAKFARLLIAFQDSGNDLEAAFARFDASGDGALSADEIFRGLRDLGNAFVDLDLADVQAFVKRFDASADGHLEYADLARFVREARRDLGMALVEEATPPAKAPATAEAKIRALFDEFEHNGGRLEDAFDKWDDSDDGLLSKAELYVGLRSLGPAFESIGFDDVAELVKRFDHTKDGHLSLREFRAFLRDHPAS